MYKKFEDYLSETLAPLNSLDLDNKQCRRIAVKPLYDYFQIVILEIAVYFCGQNRNSLANCHLKTRWDIVKTCLMLIDDPTKWDSLVYGLHNIRSSVEHNDYSSPDKTKLTQIKDQAPRFKSWMLEIGNQYKEKSEGFSFIQDFQLLSGWYIRETDSKFDMYGEKPYLIENEVYSENEHSYKKLQASRDNLELRLRNISTINELRKEDLDALVDLIRENESLDARASILIQFKTCPKCGAKIVETQRQVGGSYEDPEPSAVIIRVGCENCDYTLNEETIDI